MQFKGMEIGDFIELAKTEPTSKEEVIEALEQAEMALDAISSELADIEECINQMEIRGEEQTDKVIESYGCDPEKVKDVESWRVAHQKAAFYVEDLKQICASMNNFDKAKCFANIRALLKDSDVKIGQIEKETGVRLGYMARLEKPDNTSEPTVEFVVTAAKLLGVTVDMLISGQIDGLNGNERFVLSFLDTLIQDTLNGDMVWEKESPKELENVPYCDGQPNHILMKHAEYYDIGESGYPELSLSRAEYNSLFFNDSMRVDLLGNVYHIDLPGTDTTVYVSHISHQDIELPFPDEQYEVLIYQNGLTGLCGSRQSVSEIREQIIRLYKTIDEMNSGLGLNENIKNALGFYMNTSSPSARKKAQAEAPSIDPELPFN